MLQSGMHNRVQSNILAIILTWLVLLVPAFAGDDSLDRGDLRTPKSSGHPEPTYKIETTMDGEVYPVFANYASLQKQNQRTLGVLSVTVANNSEQALRQRVAVRVVGWSDTEIQVAELPAGVIRTYTFAPTFLPRFYENHEIVAATAEVVVSEMSGGATVYETTVPVRIRSAEDIYWGEGFKYAPFIASWVTPHDLKLEETLAQAKSFLPDHRLPGYESWKNAEQQELETYREAKAIYTALKGLGLSYVKSSDTLGGNKSLSERVRKPRISLAQTSANCIDAAVMYASLFENLGMEPTVVIVPGHAYVGVRVAHGSPKFLFIDVALTGGVPFETAVASAERGLAKYDASSVTRVLIQQARDAGIYPMP
jgi:hypothetical protein